MAPPKALTSAWLYLHIVPYFSESIEAGLNEELMEFTAKGVPLSLRAAFQEYKLEQLDPEEHRFTLIERTLAYGRREEVRWLFEHYGSDVLSEWVQDYGWRLLPRRRLLFWSTYFDLPDLPQRQGAWTH
jgi:hypothetical protein